MSAVPPIYEPLSSFATLAQSPITTAGLPGAEIDQELGLIQTTLNATRARLSEIQRDDGQLANGIVGFEALAGEILQFAVSNSVRMRGPWAPNTTYVFDGTTADVYIRNGTTRIVAVSYMSGPTFGVLDEAATGVLGAPPSIGTIIRDEFVGDGVETEFVMSQDPASPTNVHVYLDGLNQVEGTDFTLDGATVVFAVPPANAAVIVTEAGVVSEIVLTTVADGGITTPKLATGAVTATKIAGGAVGTAALDDGSVTTAKLDDAAVTSDKIAAGAISPTHFSPGAVSGASIATAGVSSDALASGAVTTSKIAASAVSTGSLADGSVSTAKLADGATTGAKMADNSITSAKYADASVTGAKIANAGVVASNLSGAQTGSAPIYGARAWVNFDATATANLTGTYTQTGTVCTIAVAAHGLRVGHTIYANFTSGTATAGEYVVDGVIDANNFTIAPPAATTSGAVDLNFATKTASGNVSSVAHIGVGIFAINFTVDMPSTNYVITGASIGTGNAFSYGVVGIRAPAFTGPAFIKTVSTVGVCTTAGSSGAVFACTGLIQTNMQESHCVFFG